MKHVLAFMVIVLPALASPAHAELRYAGNVTATAVAGTRADFTLEGGAVVRVEVTDERTLRVRFAPTGVLSAWPSPATVDRASAPAGTAVYDTADATYFVAPAFIAGVMKAPYRLAIWRPDGQLVQADLAPALAWDLSTGVVLTRKWSPPDERYYGFGERGGPLNRRGRRFAMWNKDNAAFDAYTDPLYITIPYFWGARGENVYGLFLDNPATPFFELDPDATGAVTFGALAGELDYYLFTGPTAPQVAKAYGTVTGFSALPPKWTLGYHQSRYGYASQTEALTIAATLRELQLPADALYFDIDYLDRLQLFSWNLAAFPNPWEMNYLLGQLGFHRVNIMEPIVHVDDRFWRPLADARFFLTDATGQPVVTPIWFGNVSWLDFTKTGAATWYKDTLKAFLTTGIDAVWNDLNEPAANEMPQAIYDYDGQRRPDLSARNLYALHEAALSYQAQRELRPGVRPWGISRSGYAGIQRYLANWGGDANSDWATLRTNVQMSLAMALSGQNFFGHDIGGFLGAPSAELFTRWMEFAAYTPLFRNHAMNTSPSREPWAFGEPTLGFAREILNERYRLLPFLYTLAERASRTGEPTIAPAFFYFPADQATWNDDTMFMLGDSMLVAPVLDAGATSRGVWLPGPATWVDVYTDAVYNGQAWHVVPAPLGRIPVFVRVGAIIPKGPVLQHTGERPLTDPGLHFYGGSSAPSSLTLYEDDGVSFQFESGEFLRTRVDFEPTASGARVTLERVEGTMSPPPGRVWTLELHKVSGIAAVTMNGAAVPKYASEAELPVAAPGWALAGGRVVIRIPDSSAPISVEASVVPVQPAASNVSLAVIQ